MARPIASLALASLLVASCVRISAKGSPADGAASDHESLDAAIVGRPITWVPIPAGTFKMGSPASDTCRYDNEDQHEVTLKNKFEMMDTEVTRQQFKSLMAYDPSIITSCGSNCPVHMVSWHEAAAYCDALSAKMKLTHCYSCSGTGTNAQCETAAAYAGSKLYSCPGYRLPTEAEWEYAYRAKTTTGYYNGPHDKAFCSRCLRVEPTADKIGWYCANSGSKPHPVAQKQPNAWGLYDMAGNTWEWVHDHYADNLGKAATTDPVTTSPAGFRVLRGGAWFYLPWMMRASFRGRDSPSFRSLLFGFRCVRSLTP